MSLSLHEASVPVFARMLRQLARIVGKAAAHAEEQDLDPEVLLASRLHPDMYPLLQQVQIACDAAVDGAARLAQAEAPAFPGDERDFPALVARIDRSIAFLESLDPVRFEGAED